MADACRSLSVDETSSAGSTNMSDSPSFIDTLRNHWKYLELCKDNFKMLRGIEDYKQLEGAERCSISRQDTEFTSSVERSKMVVVATDKELPVSVFPDQTRDVNSQQLDLRSSNSWLLTLSSGEISTPELAEVFAINSMAPFILASKLKPLLTALRPHKGNSNVYKSSLY